MDARRRMELERTQRRALIVGLAGAAVGVVPAILRLATGKGGWLEWLMLGFAALAVAFSIYQRWRIRQRFRQVVEADWRRCFFCFFDLRGLAERGRCPECGSEYVIQEVREAWKDAIAGNYNPPGNNDDT